MPAGMPTEPSSPPRRPSPTHDDAATLALSERAASVLAYSAGWLSGALVLALEGRRLEVRRHAAQALLGFGLLTLAGLTVLALAAVSLFVSVAVFRALLWVAQAIILVGVVSWLVALLQTARGRSWRWPLLAALADRVAALAQRRA